MPIAKVAGWIYAGNDVQMFNAVKSASACCELCNSDMEMFGGDVSS